MWSKGPFKSRRPIGNPTLAATPSESLIAADPVMAVRYAKDLPSLPYDLNGRPNDIQIAQSVGHFAGHSAENNQHPDVSPAISPELGPRTRDSGSSFCVSPIDESEDDERYSHEPTGSWGYGVANPVPPRPKMAEPSLPEFSQSAPRTINFTPNADAQPSRMNAYRGKLTQGNAGGADQGEPRTAALQKSSGSHASNFLHWGREQLQPKKKFEHARSRISSFSKIENRAPATRSRSSSRVLPVADHSISRDALAQPQNATLGFVPTVVTTITAGDPKPPPDRLITEHTYKSFPPREPVTKLDVAIDNNNMGLSEKPPSRSSASSAALDADSANGSPNDSPRASLNLGPKSTDDLSSSIMSRRRPIPVSMPISKKPVRKPTPSEAGREPQRPPEDGPKDTLGRIEALEARRNELAKRRFNLETVIHELTRVIQPNSIAYDRAAKAEVKRSVQSIENEIAEIKREEHELGLKVTRAWRRLDERENHGDGSNLWVKRVTS